MDGGVSGFFEVKGFRVYGVGLGVRASGSGV